MKNLPRLIVVLFATQLLIAGIASAAVSSSSSINQKNSVCAMPGDEEPTWEPW